jgi:hypothetical protein
MKTVLKLFKWLLNVILAICKKKELQPGYKVVFTDYLCQKNKKNMANTGKRLCYRWSYREDGQTVSACQLVKSMNGTTPVFYTGQEVQLLTDTQYAAAFDVTKDYMLNTLGWTVLPDLSESNRQNLEACPIIIVSAAAKLQYINDTDSDVVIKHVCIYVQGMMNEVDADIPLPFIPPAFDVFGLAGPPVPISVTFRIDPFVEAAVRVDKITAGGETVTILDNIDATGGDADQGLLSFNFTIPVSDGYNEFLIALQQI